MRGFVYFIEWETRTALLPGEASELTGLLGSMTCTGLKGDKSPTGKAGVLAWGKGTDRGIVDAAGKEWRRWGEVTMTGGKTMAHVGFLPSLLPGPDDLRRDEMLAGHDVVMGDGKGWRLPRLMRRTGVSDLPRAYGFDGDGNFCMDVLRPYRAIAAKGGRIYEVVVATLDAVARGENPGVDIGIGEATGIIADALSMNYRIGRVELGILELVRSDHLFALLCALVDVRLRALLREAADGGKAEASPATQSAS